MLKLSIQDANLWKRSIDAIAALIDEGCFEFSKDAMTLQTMDPSQIAMVSFKMPASAFKEYKIGDTTEIGVDITELAKIVRRARAGDSLDIEVAENKILATFKGKTTRRFTLSLIEGVSKSNKPKVEFDAMIKMPAAEFKEVLGDVELISSYIVFDARSNDELAISSQSESGKAEVLFGKDALIESNVKAPAKAIFPLEYLKNMTKNTDTDTIIEVELKNNSPLKLAYPIGDSTIEYYLAPRVENV